MTEDEIKALCKIRDKYCQCGEVAVMNKAIRLIQDQQNEIRLLKEMQKKLLFYVDDSTLGKMVANSFH